MRRKVAEIVVSLLIIIGGLALCGIWVYSVDKAEEENKKPVKVIENYEVPEEYLESPFDYESELEGKVIEVRGTVTHTSDEDYPLIAKRLIINDNIICRVSSINDSRMDLEDAKVVLRGTVVSEATTLELDECDVKVLSESE